MNTHSLEAVQNDSRVSRLVEIALIEDIGLGDLTGEAVIPEDQVGEAVVLCKADGRIAGQGIAEIVFAFCDTSLTFVPLIPDGGKARPGEIIARVDGLLRGILKGERTALNFLQRMSGIATTTSKFVKAIEGTRARVTDTRKTAPGLRVLDKLAVSLGGGINHRFGLDDMVLIKDNHIAAAGGITPAVQHCREYLDRHTIAAAIEVETSTLDEVREAIGCTGVQRIMLDNFGTELMRDAVAFIDHRCEVEASGGITLESIRAVAETGVDFISVGALTHSVEALDISLDILPARR
jgi:nicotinate-nucleotide pyrophosphorylase (carboxylating)